MSNNNNFFIKAEPNTMANIFGMVGCVCCFICPCIGCPLLCIALKQTSTDYSIDEEQQLLVVHNYGSIFGSCGESTEEYNLADIKDVTVAVDTSSTVNGENGGIISLIMNNSSSIEISHGFIALSKARRIASAMQDHILKK